MTKEQLIRIDNDLDANIEKDSILISKKGFYIYFNERNKHSKVIQIHSHSCGECAWGSGKISKKEVGKNGVWIGPFEKPIQAEDFAKDYFVGCKINIDTCVNFN